MAHPNFILNSRTLVIGGTSGIGFAVASGALASGSKVHITSSTAAKLSTKIKELQSFYPGAHVSGSAVDLSNADALEATLQSALDAAVKETGGPLDHIPFTVRYLGPLLIAKLVAAHPGRYLKAAHTSSITLTSGTLAHRPAPGFIAAIGVIGAVEALSRALAVDLAPIRVNIVIPGAGHTLTKEIGTAAEAAEAYLFCMRSALATGQGFIVDNGGLLA
ncbi:hypothetical protein DFH06DRAFT_1276782 [Mycena polygramma]|nr:hypothetical protein DFH06DRAFT_1276782 [Mycena polygramma]